MPESTTPEDNLANTRSPSDHVGGGAEECVAPANVFVTETPASAAPVPGLDDDDRAEVTAFRDNLEFEDRIGGSASRNNDRFRRQQASQYRPVVRPPGPGIPEAICWTLGVLLIHLVGGLIAGVVIVVGQVSSLAESGSELSIELVTKVLTSLPRLLETHMFELIGIEMLVFLVAAVLATWIRLGSRTSYRLGIRPLAMHHFLLILAVSIPISLMCGGLHQVTSAAWDQWFAHLPGMSFFDNMNVNESLKPLGESTSVWLLLLAIAVAPAIGEEVIFRGVIGRGLIARHGIVAGVVMTSLLFAAVHIHPAHVIALLPLAFFIHLVYLTTRSFLAPMLLHLLNNSLAIVLLKATAMTPALAESTDVDVPVFVPLLSIGIVVLVGWTLWKSRVQYRTEDGELWNPGYPTVEIPPETSGATVAFGECNASLLGGAMSLAGVCSLTFVVLLTLTITGQIAT